MRVVGVKHPGAPTCISIDVKHGQHPQKLLWQHGLVVTGWLSARSVNGVIILTALVANRSANSNPPKIKRRPKPAKYISGGANPPIVNQRIAAYALVTSARGVLGTECSTQTAVPGLWQLPGGGLQPGESPAEALNREMAEETGQKIVVDKLVDLQSDHWIGKAPNGQVEDFHALRIIYLASCANPTTPSVIDIDGTTSKAAWIPLTQWRSMPWTSGARSVLERYLPKPTG